MTTCVTCERAATPGLLLDARCLDQLAGDVAAAARLHLELDAALVRPSRPDESGSRQQRGVSVGIGLDDAAVRARHDIRATLVTWVRRAQQERPRSGRTVEVTPAASHAAPGASVPAAGAWPADTVPSMARWISRNLTWYAGRPWITDMTASLARAVDQAAAAIQPDRPRRLDIGDCPERLVDDDGQDAGPCHGTLFALIRPADSLLPSDVRCTDGEHRWTADQWHALGRRVRRMDERAARRLAAHLLDGPREA